eukprot:7519318-Alexandrium_andersonii.AAC.2
MCLSSVAVEILTIPRQPWRNVPQNQPFSSIVRAFEGPCACGRRLLRKEPKAQLRCPGLNVKGTLVISARGLRESA